VSRIERGRRRRSTTLAEPAHGGNAMVAVLESVVASPYVSTTLNSTIPGGRELDLRPTEEMALSSSSCCGDGEGYVSETTHSSPLFTGRCHETLHELSNLVTALVLNAQALECKLPAYSHLKRPVRQLSRTAQRTGQLMKQLMRDCAERIQGNATEMP